MRKAVISCKNWQEKIEYICRKSTLTRSAELTAEASFIKGGN